MEGRRIVQVVLAAALLVVGKLQAQEIPLMVQTNSEPKALLLIDDSGSMESFVYHPDYVPGNSVSKNSSLTIPSIIFRVESGKGAANPNSQIRPALVEYNPAFSAKNGDPWLSVALKNGSTAAAVSAAGCVKNRTYTTCPAPGPSMPTDGVNTLSLYGNSSVIGNDIFKTSNLFSSGGKAYEDPDGNEYLYAQYRQNDYKYYYATAGGPIYFNGRLVNFPAGYVDIEYLRWVFYAATPEQLENIGGSRMEIVKNVVEDLIISNPDVEFGLGLLNGGAEYRPRTASSSVLTNFFSSAGAIGYLPSAKRLWRPIGSSHADLIADVQKIPPYAGTPLHISYIEMLQYFAGEAGYTSPIKNSCDTFSVIMLTDGMGWSGKSGKLHGSFIKDYDKDNKEPVSDSGSCGGKVATIPSPWSPGTTTSIDLCEVFSDDAAHYAHNLGDFSSSIEGDQRVRTYTIGLDIDISILDDIAQKGGTSSSFKTTSYKEVKDAFQNIVDLLITSPASASSVSLSEGPGLDGRVFRPRFSADQWSGNLDVFKYDTKTNELNFQFDFAEKLANRDLTATPRKIFYGEDSDFDGNTNQMAELDKAQAQKLRPILFRDFLKGDKDTSLLANPLKDINSDSSAGTLIEFIQGNEIVGLRSRDRDRSGGTADLGDIVHSSPVEVGPQNGDYARFLGYNDYVTSKRNDPRIVLIGANDGMLHAFNSETGEEEWAYIPSSLLPELEMLSRPSYNRDYRRAFVDGKIHVQDVYFNSGWKTVAFFGLRSGGSSYIALDISDRLNPSLLFEVSAVDELGESWSSPAVVVSNGVGNNPDDFRWYMVVGSGEGRDDKELSLGAYEIVSGITPTVQKVTLKKSEDEEYRTGDILAVQTDKDMNVDRLYVGTESGDMYRVEVDGTPDNWESERVFEGSSDHPVVAKPAALFTDNPRYKEGEKSGIQSMKYAIGVYWGTGRYEEKADIKDFGSTEQRIYGIFDPINPEGDDYKESLKNLEEDDLQDQTSAYTVVRSPHDGIYRVPQDKNGFFLRLKNSIEITGSKYIEPAGMVLAAPAVFRGNLVFSTFLPNVDSCDVGGHGFLISLNFRTGGGSILNRQDSENPYFSGGIPDVDKDTDYDQTDLIEGLKSGILSPAIDAEIESIVLSSDKPYSHDGKLTLGDVRLAGTSGGILPAVSSLGERGAPMEPQVLTSVAQIVVDTGFKSTPKIGNPDTGSTDSSTGNGKDSDSSQSKDVDPPELLPLATYNLPVRRLSFHEVTRN